MGNCLPQISLITRIRIFSYFPDDFQHKKRNDLGPLVKKSALSAKSAGGYFAFSCLNRSYNIIPAATPTFSEAISPPIGIDKRASDIFSRSGEIPLSSEPMMVAVGPKDE